MVNPRCSSKIKSLVHLKIPKTRILINFNINYKQNRGVCVFGESLCILCSSSARARTNHVI